MSRLRRIAALLTGDQAVDGLTATQAAALDAAVCQAIVNELDIEAADITPACLFAAWAARAGYRLPLELFTVNYDLLLETALEIACEMVERFPESAALKSKLVSAIAQYGLVIRGSYADHEFGIAAAIEGARDALGGKYPHERSWLDDLARKFREAAKRTKRQEDDEWTED